MSARKESYYTITDAGYETPCWMWDGAFAGSGYGQDFYKGKKWRAHRSTYERLVGPIPAGMDLDHLCRNRRCVNPDHLEPVTRRENLLRGETRTARNAAVTHCPQGHPYTEANTYVRASGARVCKKCNAERNNRRYHERVGIVHLADIGSRAICGFVGQEMAPPHAWGDVPEGKRCKRCLKGLVN